jgi:hypothetical protein
MMQATDFADRDDLAELRRLDRPHVRHILGQERFGTAKKSMETKAQVWWQGTSARSERAGGAAWA